VSSELTAVDGRTTKHRRSLRRALVNWAWPIFRDFPRELLKSKLARFAVAGSRYSWYVLLLRRLRTTAGEGVAKSTVAHNIRGMMDLHVERSVRLIYPIAAWAAARRIDLRDLKVLTIGPRTEGEIFNLVAHGFRRRNIAALDLISYSPMVQLGDMHAMPYPDASFDVVLAGWVISYSDRKEVAAAEIARVAKPGAIIAIGIEWGRRTPEQIAADITGYIVGSANRLLTAQAILDLFGERVERVYAKVDDQDFAPEDAGDLLVVFRLR
jgi:SAM-dependent methyltransferase